MNPIINLADHLPRMTAEDLMAEAKRNITGEMPPFEEFLFSLPKHLRDCLDFGISGIDYRQMKDSEIAATMRILAMLVVAFDSYLGTSIGRASCKAFSENSLEWCVAMLKSMCVKPCYEMGVSMYSKSSSRDNVVKLAKPRK